MSSNRVDLWDNLHCKINAFQLMVFIMAMMTAMKAKTRWAHSKVSYHTTSVYGVLASLVIVIWTICLDLKTCSLMASVHYKNTLRYPD